MMARYQAESGNGAPASNASIWRSAASLAGAMLASFAAIVPALIPTPRRKDPEDITFEPPSPRLSPATPLWLLLPLVAAHSIALLYLCGSGLFAEPRHYAYVANLPSSAASNPVIFAKSPSYGVVVFLLLFGGLYLALNCRSRCQARTALGRRRREPGDSIDIQRLGLRQPGARGVWRCPSHSGPRDRGSGSVKSLQAGSALLVAFSIYAAADSGAHQAGENVQGYGEYNVCMASSLTLLLPILPSLHRL